MHVNVEVEYDDKLDEKPMEAGSVNDPSVKEFKKRSSRNNEMWDMSDRKWRYGRESVTEPERDVKSLMQREKDPIRQPEADVTSGTKLLILGILFCLKYFEYYILNAPVKVVTNHSALAWINKMANENHRLTRWALAIQKYDIEEVKYTPRKELGDVNGLSRAFI